MRTRRNELKAPWAARKISQGQLAIAGGVSRQTIYVLENDRSDPSPWPWPWRGISLALSKASSTTAPPAGPRLGRCPPGAAGSHPGPRATAQGGSGADDYGSSLSAVTVDRGAGHPR